MIGGTLEYAACCASSFIDGWPVLEAAGLTDATSNDCAKTAAEAKEYRNR
jgi:hypothetical protein